MDEEKRSPRITHISWGRIEVEGRPAPFKDVKLFPGGCREWDWRETGTNHTPGVMPDDVAELVDRGATVLVLGTGIHGRLEVCPDTLEWLKARGARVYVQRTEEAVKTYNSLAGECAVGGVFHTTC